MFAERGHLPEKLKRICYKLIRQLDYVTPPPCIEAFRFFDQSVWIRWAQIKLLFKSIAEETAKSTMPCPQAVVSVCPNLLQKWCSTVKDSYKNTLINLTSMEGRDCCRIYTKFCPTTGTKFGDRSISKDDKHFVAVELGFMKNKGKNHLFPNSTIFLVY